jgi:hypothetical protein
MRTPPARLQSAAGWVVTCIGRSLLLPTARINHPAITVVFVRAAAGLLVLEAHGCTPSPQPGQALLSVDLRGHTSGPRLAPRLIHPLGPALRFRRTGALRPGRAVSRTDRLCLGGDVIGKRGVSPAP